MNTNFACRGQRKAIKRKEVASQQEDAEATPMTTKQRKVGSACQPTQYSTTNGTEEELEFPMFHDDTSVESEYVDFGGINTSIRENWNEYVQFADENLYLFTKYERNAIDLLLHLCKTKASLKTYESIMEWHLCATGQLLPGQALSQCKTYIPRAKLFHMLKERYNMCQENLLKIHTIVLPHSKAKAKVVVNDAKYVLQSLLTDPRICDEDYFFLAITPLPHRQVH